MTEKIPYGDDPLEQFPFSKETLHLMSSWGIVSFDRASGVVCRRAMFDHMVDEEDYDPLYFDQITLIDVRRLQIDYPDHETKRCVDILHAGFWYERDGKRGYEPPDYESLALSRGQAVIS